MGRRMPLVENLAIAAFALVGMLLVIGIPVWAMTKK